MTKDNLPKAVYSGEIKLGDTILNVHVLDNGQRIIDQESMERFMEYLSSPDAKQASEEDLANLGKFIHGGKIEQH